MDSPCIILQAHRSRLDYARQQPEVGLTTVERVVLIAVAVSIAIAVGAAIRSRIIDKANTIPLG
jgi:hypothetical protein